MRVTTHACVAHPIETVQAPDETLGEPLLFSNCSVTEKAELAMPMSALPWSLMCGHECLLRNTATLTARSERDYALATRTHRYFQLHVSETSRPDRSTFNAVAPLGATEIDDSDAELTLNESSVTSTSPICHPHRPVSDACTQQRTGVWSLPVCGGTLAVSRSRISAGLINDAM